MPVFCTMTFRGTETVTQYLYQYQCVPNFITMVD